MLKIATIVGARPQFIKASMLSRALQGQAEEVMIHTGQHYDNNMSQIFFDQLLLPKPDHELQVGSGSHAKQTATMMVKLEGILEQEKPDWVVVFGDTNSTLAGSLTAAKLNIPLAHIEAGLRSYNRKMPEEINRVLTDHVSTLLFCPTDRAVANLSREGIVDGVYQVGDIMFDALQYFQQQARQATLPTNLPISLEQPYVVATIHRAENTDHIKHLRNILLALSELDLPVLLPLHPRTRHAITRFGLEPLLQGKMIKTSPPLSYFEMVTVVSHAKLVLTDSGGLQKEAYMLRVPCITLRNETEWPETLDHRWNQLTGADKHKIIQAVKTMKVPSHSPPIFGNGHTASTIVEHLKRA